MPEDAAPAIAAASRPSPSAGPSGAVIAAVCGAQILGMAGYSTVPALLPQFIADWSLSNAEGGWLAGMVFAGYMLGVLPLVGLTDRLPARGIYLASSALNAVSCFGVALSDHLLPALALRALAGLALAGMYMPGLRALVEGVEGTRRARIAAFYTSAFTIGAATSFLFGQAGTLWGWRSAFHLAGLLGVAGVLIAWRALPKPPAGAAVPLRGRLDFRPVFANRDALVLIFDYAAAIWGSAGVRQWIVVFLAFCAERDGGGAPGWSMLAVGAFINFLGVPAGLLGNELALRLGLRNTAALVFAASALTSGIFGLAAALPYPAVVGLSLAAGFIAQGNFSNLTSGVLAAADPRYTGATVALYSCAGFGGGFLGTLVFGVMLDALGGATRLAAWVLSFAACGLVSLAGAAATALLSRDLGRTPRPGAAP